MARMVLGNMSLVSSGDYRCQVIMANIYDCKKALRKYLKTFLVSHYQTVCCQQQQQL